MSKFNKIPGWLIGGIIGGFVLTVLFIAIYLLGGWKENYGFLYLSLGASPFYIPVYFSTLGILKVLHLESHVLDNPLGGYIQYLATYVMLGAFIGGMKNFTLLFNRSTTQKISKVWLCLLGLLIITIAFTVYTPIHRKQIEADNALARDPESIEVCQKFKGNQFNSCIKNLAEKTGNLSYCDQITGDNALRNHCYTGLNFYGVKDVCQKIDRNVEYSGVDMAQCLSRSCYPLSNQIEKNTCFYTAAKESADALTCNKISDSKLSKQCWDEVYKKSN